MTEDPMHYTPWSGPETLTKADIEEWLASREEAGRAIDIATCEIRCVWALDHDAYGFRRDLTPEMGGIGGCLFVRSPDSRGWIAEDNLPAEKYVAACDRLEAERASRRGG